MSNNLWPWLSDWCTFVDGEMITLMIRTTQRDRFCTDAVQHSPLISWPKKSLSSRRGKLVGRRNSPTKTLEPLSYPKTASDLSDASQDVRTYMQPCRSISCHNRDLSATAPVQSLFEVWQNSTLKMIPIQRSRNYSVVIRGCVNIFFDFFAQLCPVLGRRLHLPQPSPESRPIVAPVACWLAN